MKKLVSKMFYDSLGAIVFAAIAGTIGMVVDGVLIGRCLGAEQMASFGIASPVFLVVFALAGIFSSGMQAKCSERIGAGRTDEANEIFSLAVTISLLLSAAIMVVLLTCTAPLARVLGASGSAERLRGDTVGYLAGLSFGIPAIILQQCLQPVMQLDGDNIRIFEATIVTTLADIAADILNVYVFHGGMFGMALATSISYYAGLGVFLLHFRKAGAAFRYSVRHTPWRHTKELITTGLPTAVGRFSTTFRTFTLNRLLLSISGTAAVTALSTQTNVNNFFSSAGVGISMSVLMLAGVYYGEEDRDEMRCLLQTAMRAACTIVTALGVLLFVCTPLFSAMYLDRGTDEFAVCIRSLRYLAVSMPFHALCNVFVNYLQGTRNLRLSHLTCFLHEFLLVVLCAFVLGHAYGAEGVWLAFPIGKVLTLLSVWIMACLYQKRSVHSLAGLLFLPDDFDREGASGCAPHMELRRGTPISREELGTYCANMGADEEKTRQIADICDIVAAHFTAAARDTSVMILRLVQKDGSFMLRCRDDAAADDIKAWPEYDRLCRMSENMQYNRMMNTNSLLIQI